MALLDLLERLRSHAGDRPLQIISGVRTKAHNAAVGGAPASQHLVGTAADIPPGIVRPDRAHELGAVGVGESGGWAIHVDVREGPNVDWSYD